MVRRAFGNAFGPSSFVLAVVLATWGAACASPSDAGTATGASEQNADSTTLRMDGTAVLAFRTAKTEIEKVPAGFGTWIFEAFETQALFKTFRFVFRNNEVDPQGNQKCVAIEVVVRNGATDTSLESVRTVPLAPVQNNDLCR